MIDRTEGVQSYLKRRGLLTELRIRRERIMWSGVEKMLRY